MENVELIPDFDELEKLAMDSARLKAELVVLKHKLSSFQAKLMREAKTNKEYWIGGKMPTDTYCKSTIMYIGNTVEDAAELERLITKTAEKTEAYFLIQELIRIKRDRLSLFQTLSANTRKGYLQ